MPFREAVRAAEVVRIVAIFAISSLYRAAPNGPLMRGWHSVLSPMLIR